MIKKTCSLIVLSGLFSMPVLADDGKINFVGAITDDACTIVNNMTNPLTVTLGTVSSGAFTAAGTTAAPTKFTLALKSCPSSVISATVKFDGIADNNENTLLALTQDAGVAKNVGIQLMDKNYAVVPLYTASSSYPLVTGDNSLDFIARYYATAVPVTAGPANSTSNFTIVYN